MLDDFEYLLALKVGEKDSFDNTEPNDIAPYLRPAYKKIVYVIAQLNARCGQQAGNHFAARKSADNSAVEIIRIYDGETSFAPPPVTRSNKIFKKDIKRKRLIKAPEFNIENLQNIVDARLKALGIGEPEVKLGANLWIVNNILFRNEGAAKRYASVVTMKVIHARTIL